jgi:exonuclease III
MDHENISLLKVASFNCQGAMRSSIYICKLLQEYQLDVLIVCEHWLFPDSVVYLESLDSEYVSHAVSDKGLDVLDPYRRGKGGVGILWHRRINHAVSVLRVDSGRIIGITVELEKKKFLTVLGVYLPSTSSHLDDFRDEINLLHATYQMCSEYSEVIVLGDLNGQMSGPRCICDQSNPRTKALSVFTCDEQLCSLMVQSDCAGPDYTYCNCVGGPQTLIDHILIKECSCDLVVDYAVIDDDVINISDHLPVRVKINVSPLKTSNHLFCYSALKWKSVNSDYIKSTYELVLNENLSAMKNTSLDDPKSIENFYNAMTSVITQTACEYIPRSQYKSFIKPYWKKGLGVIHKEMLAARKCWISYGRPRGNEHVSYFNYKQSKRKFRLLHRRLQHDDEQDFYQELEHYSEVDQNKFWSMLNRKKRKKAVTETCLKIGNCLS